MSAPQDAPARRVVLRLNQQQLELIDRSLGPAGVADRAALIRLALRDYAALAPEDRR